MTSVYVNFETFLFHNNAQLNTNKTGSNCDTLDVDANTPSQNVSLQSLLQKVSPP